MWRFHICNVDQTARTRALYDVRHVHPNRHEAAEALQRSTQAIARAADRLRDQAETSAATTREQVVATVRAYPVTAGAIAAIATLATMRLSQ